MNPMRTLVVTILGGALLISAPVSAQTVPPTVTTPMAPGEAEMFYRGQSRDPLADAFFPPELVMQHQQAIGLSGEQRAAIVNLIAAAQPRFIEAQWALQPETAALAELVRGDRVNEQQVLAQIDRVLDIERQIKRLQIEMLIRIKNQLTAEQQQQLARLGGVRLRGYLDSSRPKVRPGIGLSPAEWDAFDSFDSFDYFDSHESWKLSPGVAYPPPLGG